MKAALSSPLLAMLADAQADPPAGPLVGIERKVLAKGHLVATPGQGPDRTLIVERGRLRVYLSGASRDLSLSFLERGDIYTTHTPTYIETVSLTTLWVMDTQRFARQMAGHPAASPVVMRVLGRLLTNAVSLLEDLSFREVPARLARFLVSQAQRRGVFADGVWQVPLDLNTSELASLLGSTRQTVSALLNQWGREGLLRREGRHLLVICSIDALDALSKPLDERA